MISQFSVFKKVDPVTNETQYIINTGDIHNILSKFNISQSEEIKKIIQNACDGSLFLFEYPFNLPVENESIEKCRVASALAVNRFHNPVFLHDYAALYNKVHRSIDYRSHTLIFNIFSNLVQDFINSQITNRRELNISFSDIAKLMINTFERVESDYNELRQMKEQSLEMPESQKILIDVYVDSFEKYNADFQANKNYAEELANIKDEIIDYLIAEFAKFKKSTSESVINELINNNITLAQEFGMHASQHCLQKIMLSFFNTIELNILKEMIFNTKMSKIFLFIGSMHANNINQLLIKCGYEKIYENIATTVEILNQLSAKNINVLSSDLSELVPVSSDLLAKLAESELTQELFSELEKMKNLEKASNIPQAPTSWLRRITDFLGL